MSKRSLPSNGTVLQYLHETVDFPLPITKGRYILGALFLETPDLVELQGAIEDSIGPRPIFTLKTYDYEIPKDSKYFREEGPNKLRSLHQLYLQYEDPSEYDFALGVFKSFEHWEQLTECLFFQEHLKKMRKTLEIKLDARTVRAAKEAMDNGIGPVALQAAKWLNSRVVKTSKRGRPSNEEIEGEIKRQAEEAQILNDDLKRIL